MKAATIHSTFQTFHSVLRFKHNFCDRTLSDRIQDSTKYQYQGAPKMKSTNIVSIIACSMLFMISSLAFADTAATRTMADITMTLNHYPSDSEKQTLMAIAESDDSSESEITVATGISNMKHQVAAGDKEKLHSIIADDSAPADLRALASILISINHKPTESDIEQLKKIASGPGD